MKSIVLSLMFLTGAAAWAASPRLETFDSGLNGWTNVAAPNWRGTNGYAQVIFPATPVPQISTLLATGALASSSFMGDYNTADIGLISFRIQALNVLPSGLTLRWMRGTNGYFRNLQNAVQATGLWYSIYCSLADKDTGGWSGDEADVFPFVLESVDSVSLSILTPAILSAATFRVDDIQIDHLHRGRSIQTTPGLNLSWENLQSNLTYRLEQCSTVDQPWTPDTLVIATNRSISITMTNLPAYSAWRLVLP